MAEKKMIPVYLDLDPDEMDAVTSHFILERTKLAVPKMVARMKMFKLRGIFYDTRSNKLFQQAQDLFYGGFDEGCIIVCRAAAEYLAYERFYAYMPLEEDVSDIDTYMDARGFRNLVNDMSKQGVISRAARKYFHQVYDTGNQWVHPKSPSKNASDHALEVLTSLGQLMSELNDVFRDHDVKDGAFKSKSDARKQLRPRRLASSKRSLLSIAFGLLFQPILKLIGLLR